MDRQTVVWVALIILSLFLIGLLVAKGPSLGQNSVNEKLQKERQAKLDEEYKAKVINPQAYTQEELDRAQRAVMQNKPPAPPASIPMPPVNEDMMLKYARALEAIEKSKKEGDRSSPHAAASGASPALKGENSFVMYSNASGDGRGLLGVSQAKSAQTSAPQSPEQQAIAEQNALAKQIEEADSTNPQVLAAQAQLSALKQRDALAAKQAAAQNAAGVGGQNALWLFDAQNERVKDVASNIVAQRNKALYWIAPGTTIPAVLLNAVDTQLPGTLTARVTQDIYDSRYGKYLVVPRGSILRGKYNSSIQDGQNRVLMVFDTLITPAGGEIPLGNMSASDALGRSGIQGTLHTHFWERMGISTLLALEAVGMDKLSPNSTTVGVGGSSTSPAANGAQIIVNTANQEIQRRYSVSPNITIPAGALLNIVTTGGIEVPPIANAR
jgi:type IV secretion system protein VirB10